MAVDEQIDALQSRLTAALTEIQQVQTELLGVVRELSMSNRQAKDEADNNLKVAEASLQLAEAKLAKMAIVAPFSGIIGLRSVSTGDYVKEGADLVNLESIDPLKVDFRVPEIYMRQVQVGQSLQVQLDALPNKTFDGKVFAVPTAWVGVIEF